MQNLFVSTMRTLVPVVVGLALSLTGRLGIPVDSETAALVVAAGLTAAYYVVFRALEALAEHLAWRPLQLAAGVLLGWARPPAYEKELAVPLRFTVDKQHLDQETRAALAALRRAVGGEERSG